jgi:hypothetical protein
MTREMRARLISELRIASETLAPVDLADISQRYNISPNSVRGMASRVGIPLRVAKETLLERIMAVASVEKTRADVATELGERPDAVQRAYRHAKNKGIHIPQRGRALHKAWLKASLTAYGLPPEVETWLIEQMPTGTSLPDLIRAIIVDAYHEEMGE